MGFILDFFKIKLWVKGNGRVMGFSPISPAYLKKSAKKLWLRPEYGLAGIWTITEATVLHAVIHDKSKLIGSPSTVPLASHCPL